MRTVIQKRDYLIFGVIPWICIILGMVTRVAYTSLLVSVLFLSLIVAEGLVMEMWVAIYFKRRREEKKK